MGSIGTYLRSSLALLIGGALIYGGIFRYFTPAIHPSLAPHTTDGFLIQIALGAAIIFLQIRHELVRGRRLPLRLTQNTTPGSRLGLGLGKAFIYFGHLIAAWALCCLVYWLIAQPIDGAYYGLGAMVALIVAGAAYGVGGLIKQFTGN